jgi:hypothetical protein
MAHPALRGIGATAPVASATPLPAETVAKSTKPPASMPPAKNHGLHKRFEAFMHESIRQKMTSITNEVKAAVKDAKKVENAVKQKVHAWCSNISGWLKEKYAEFHTRASADEKKLMSTTAGRFLHNVAEDCLRVVGAPFLLEIKLAEKAFEEGFAIMAREDKAFEASENNAEDAAFGHQTR